MIVPAWIFIGFLVGLLVVAVFEPPARKDMHLPTPNDKNPLFTDTGCVKFTTIEVACTPEASSLNFIASQHK
jgi:hypothetical protein